jgi:hypothetical protein
MGDMITISEAADRLKLDRSGVFRKAKQGVFGPIQEIRGPSRTTVILVSETAVDDYLTEQAAT